MEMHQEENRVFFVVSFFNTAKAKCAIRSSVINISKYFLHHFSSDCLEIKNVVNGKAAGQSYDPIIGIS